MAATGEGGDFDRDFGLLTFCLETEESQHTATSTRDFHPETRPVAITSTATTMYFRFPAAAFVLGGEESRK
jgi:hypothetical protein